MAQTEEGHSDSMTFKQSLPPIRNLLEEAWDLFTKKAGKLVLLMIFSIVAYVVFFIVAGVLLFGVGVANFSGATSDSFLQLFSNTTFLVTGGIVLLSFFVFSAVFNIALQAAYIFILADKEEKSVMDYVKRGLRYVWPLIVVGMISGFIAIGGFFLLIIPGIIFGLLFTFTTYEVVLENKRGMEAIKASAGMVLQHFGGVIIRMLFLWVAYMIIVMAIPSMLTSDEAGVRAGMMLIRYLFNVAANLFIAAYLFVLYKQVRAAYDVKRKITLNWIWIVSIIGWVAGVLIVVGIFQAARQFPSLPAVMQQLNEEDFSGEDQYEFHYNYDDEYETYPDEQASPYTDENIEQFLEETGRTNEL